MSDGEKKTYTVVREQNDFSRGAKKARIRIIESQTNVSFVQHNYAIKLST